MGRVIFSQVGIAQRWSGRLPSELGICDPSDDVALMASYLRQRDLMSAYESQEREKDARTKANEREAKNKFKTGKKR